MGGRAIPIYVDSPLGVAANSAASFLSSQAESRKAKAEQDRLDAKAAADAAYQNAQMQLAQQNAQLNTDKFAHEKDQDTITNALESAKAVTTAKTQAALELHQAREDAINQAKEDYQHDRDVKTYHSKILDVTLRHRDAQDRLKADRDVASVRASATLGAAQIHAAASLEAAGIRESGADARQTRAERFQQQQQGRTLAHQDNLKGAASAGGPNAADWKTIDASGAVKKLPAKTQIILKQGIEAYGAAAAISHLRAGIASGKLPPGMTASEATAALNAITTGDPDTDEGDE